MIIPSFTQFSRRAKKYFEKHPELDIKIEYLKFKNNLLEQGEVGDSGFGELIKNGISRQ